MLYLSWRWMDVGRHGSARMDHGYDDDAKSYMFSEQVIHSSGTKSKRSLAVMLFIKRIFHVILNHLFIQLSTATNLAPPLHAVSANQSARCARYATLRTLYHAMQCHATSCPGLNETKSIQSKLSKQTKYKNVTPPRDIPDIHISHSRSRDGVLGYAVLCCTGSFDTAMQLCTHSACRSREARQPEAQPSNQSIYTRTLPNRS